MRHATIGAVALCLGAFPALAEVPPSAVKLLTDRNFDVAVVAAAEAELAVPAAWIEAAANEPPLRYTGTSTPEQAAAYLAAFNERYPGIRIEYTEGVGAGRAVRPLATWQAGSPISDIVVAFGSSMNDYYAADALEPLSDLPALSTVPPEMRDDQGRWTGMYLSNWCMAFNPTRITREEMPKTWEELVAPDGVLAGGRMGVANRPHLWLANLWGAKGPDWVKTEFLPAFFGNLKPQLRSEGIDGTLRLAVLGEYDVAFPANEAVVAAQAAQGSPLEFHCLDIVPQYFSEIGMFRNSPSANSAKVLINWLLSTEGQLVRFAATDYVPIHQNLQSADYVPYGDVIFANTVHVRTIDLLVNAMPEIYEVWNAAWAASGGPGN
jgi:iron(III) transport system substrate-binding protein